MRVQLTPRITNYSGEPISKEVGIIRPPSDFYQLLKTYCIDKKIQCQLESSMDFVEFIFKGPYALVRRSSDKLLMKTIDFRSLHNFTLDKTNDRILRMQEESLPDNNYTMVFSDIKARDMNHLKLGTWMSYWETIKTNRVIFTECRGIRCKVFKRFKLYNT